MSGGNLHQQVSETLPPEMGMHEDIGDLAHRGVQRGIADRGVVVGNDNCVPAIDANVISLCRGVFHSFDTQVGGRWITASVSPVRLGKEEKTGMVPARWALPSGG